MAKFIDERRIVENSAFEFEDRLHSPIVQRSNRTLTPTRYYHLINVESTTDQGLVNVEENVGGNSGLRFHRIDDFPIGLNAPIQLNLSETDHGIDSSYEGEATILPNTIRPVPNSYFLINYLSDSYIFKVTGIRYDNISADNTYIIEFKLDNISDEIPHELDMQSTTHYDCVLRNIGTEKECLIEHEKYAKIRSIETMYDEITHIYLSLFYNERYNDILGPGPANTKIYDPYLTRFINSEGLFKDNDVFTITYLQEEISDQQFLLKYQKSVFQFIKKPDMNRLQRFPLEVIPGCNLPETQFYVWRDNSIFVTSVPSCQPKEGIAIFSDNFVEMVQDTTEIPDDSYSRLLSLYIRNEPLSIYDIRDDLLDNLITLEWNIELFYITPLILFIIRKLLTDALTISED